MATREQLDAALASYRTQLARLHELALERDHVARMRPAHSDRIARSNELIALQRATVREARAAVAEILAEGVT